MASTEENTVDTSSFKKPLLVGKIGRLPKQLKNTPSPRTEEPPPPPAPDYPSSEPKPPESPPPKEEEAKSVPYEEPEWGGLPDSGHRYSLEVLKNGSILETIHLNDRPFWVFGRLPNCDVCMQHPTISRYHAVLQYRSEQTQHYTRGYYICDLESTHGTFLNKNRVRAKTYIRMHVGHMLKLGCSTRTYILNGPDEDREQESDLSVTELKQKRHQALLQKQKDDEDRQRREEERGIDWGMGEDADEETDLAENPYAETNNEDLYIDNPKKTLRGFFEREGLDLEYDCSEQGIGQFLCKVELPIDDEMGRPIFAELTHKGKKKEAVVQCALEACRILDRHGLLRQATHESRKRKPKNWEENDYYDSDDDTFLDRTGAIEKKREKRMNAKLPQKAETYENLLDKERRISTAIRDLEAELRDTQQVSSIQVVKEDEVDPLDSFMMELKQSKPSTRCVKQLKADLVRLKQEHGHVIKLVNIAKPASLPPLVAEYATTTTVATMASTSHKTLPMFGKRKKIKVQLPAKVVDSPHNTVASDEDDLDTTQQKCDMVEENKDKDKDTKMSDKGAKILRKKHNNKRQLQQEQREQIERKKGYVGYETTDEYSMWVPPMGQSGDGRTTLNDKYGY